MRFRFLPPARREMFRAASHYDRQSAGLGSRFLDDVRKGFSSIREFPNAHPPIDPTLRRLLLSNFPYTVVYHIERDGNVIIIALAHTSRKPGYWRRRKMPD